MPSRSLHLRLIVWILCLAPLQPVLLKAGEDPPEPLAVTKKSNNPDRYFTNVAHEVGLAEHPAQRVALIDLDGDGFLDVLLRNQWQTPSTTLLLSREHENGALRTFQDITMTSRIARHDAERVRQANVLIFADVDNDGDADAFSGIYSDHFNPKWKGDPEITSAILLNDGHGAFERLESCGVESHPATTCAATFFDYNNDGRIDLFVGNWYRRYGESNEAHQDRLYRGVLKRGGKPAFEDVTAKAGLQTVPAPGQRNSAKPVYGAGHCDYNNDGWQDLLVCVYGRQWNFLWENDGKGGFIDVAERVHFDGDRIDHGRYPQAVKEYFREKYGTEREDELPFRANGNTFSVACADYDRDGDIDLFLGEITHAWAGDSSDLSALLVNGGKKERFVFERLPGAAPRRHANETSWNQGDMHVAWFDFDNDGLQDLLVSSGDYPDGQYLRLFRQREDHALEEITAACGFDWESSSGISLGDFDRDGDIDILAGKSWMRMPKDRRSGPVPAPALFRNEVGSQNNWITIQLRGKGKGGANGLGIGARITVEAGGVRQVREIRGGCGHAGQLDPPEAHFGLGPADLIERITVRWPNKRLSIQRIEKVQPNRVIQIRERGGIEEVDLKATSPDRR